MSSVTKNSVFVLNFFEIIGKVNDHTFSYSLFKRCYWLKSENILQEVLPTSKKSCISISTQYIKNKFAVELLAALHFLLH